MDSTPPEGEEERGGGGVSASPSPSPPPSPPPPTTALVLEPAPNTSTRAACLVGDVLVTVHKSGVRLYREATTDTAAAPLSGVWHLYEKREASELTEAYLCAAADPVALHSSSSSSGGVGGGGGRCDKARDGAAAPAPPSAYSRYFAVAAGSDRTVHSVCVLSTAAHFCLHHELHGRNRVVALHFALPALDAHDAAAVAPLVVSIDEAGEVVLFYVARETAVRLRCREGGLARLSDSDVEGHRRAAVDPAREEASIIDEIALYEASSPRATGPAAGARQRASIVSALAGRAVGDGPHRTDTDEEADVYRLVYGVATGAVLAGPCVTLCRRCSNLFSPPGRSGSPWPSPRSAPTPARYMAVSLLLSTRARDLPCETADQAEGVKAELGVVLLRILCGPTQAYVWHEVELVREPAPRHVCDAGVALSALPSRAGRPSVVLVGRPHESLWRLSACTGQRLDTLRVRPGGEGGGGGHGSVLLRWLPLGLHVLGQGGGGGGGDGAGRVWSCAAAVTDTGAVLLLGRDPGVEEAGSGEGPTLDGAPFSSEAAAEASGQALEHVHAQREREVLEAWLAEVEDAGLEGEGGPAVGPPRADGDTGGRATPTPRPSSPAPAPGDYCVLRLLYAPGPARPPTPHRRRHRRRPSQRGGSVASDGSRALSSRSRSTSASSSSAASSRSQRPRRSGRPEGVELSSPSAATAPALGRDWPHLLAVDPAHRSLLLFPSHDPAAALRVALPFRQPEERWSPTAGGAEGGAAERGSGEESEGVGGVWSVTRRALTAAVAPAAWLGGGARRSGEASGGEVEAHGLGLVRPLAAALLSWTGEGRKEEGEVRVGGSSASGVPPPPSLPAEEGRPGGSAGGGSIAGSPTGRPGPVRVVGAIGLDRPRPRRRCSGSPPPSSTTEAAGDEAAALHRRYTQEQVRRVMERAAQWAESPTVVGGSAHSGGAGEVAAALERLVLHTEPAARAAVRYDWEDGHTRLYAECALGAEAAAEWEGRRRAARAARARREATLYTRECGSDMGLVGHGVHGVGVGTATTSVAFLARYRELREGRQRLRDRRGVFDFPAYFAAGGGGGGGGVPPQPLLDLQERDKCQFELADLRRRQERSLAGLDPRDCVQLYQNEERSSAGDDWVAHPTFPYDAVDGSVVDLAAWNGTAGPTEPGTYVWDSAEAAETSASPPQARALTRELREWALGPWQYAPRWPTPGAAGEDWSTREGADARVRRRLLSRWRVHVKVQAAREALIAEHQREIDALREELGL